MPPTFSPFLSFTFGEFYRFRLELSLFFLFFIFTESLLDLTIAYLSEWVFEFLSSFLLTLELLFSLTLLVKEFMMFMFGAMKLLIVRR